MSRYAQKTPVIINQNDNLKLERILFTSSEFDEGWMQELLENKPELLPVAEIDTSYFPLICIGREVKTNAGRIDNLYISPTGHITIVETKLWRNQESRRKVFAQIIDYAKDLKEYSYQDIDYIAKKYKNNNKSLFGMMLEKELLIPEDEATFVDSVQKNLNSGKFLLLIVGDGIQEGVVKMTEFFNSTPNILYTMALLELEVYKLMDKESEQEQGRLVIPNLLMKTTNIERGIFRIEKGNITFEEAKIEEVEETKSRIGKSDTEQDTASIEDFINEIKSNNHELANYDFDAFFEDLNSLDYQVQPLKTSGNVVIKYVVPQTQKKIDIIFLSKKNDIGAYKSLNSLERDLVKNGYSGEIAKQFYQEMLPYQEESNTKETAYKHNIAKILKNKEDILGIFERLKSKLG